MQLSKNASPLLPQPLAGINVSLLKPETTLLVWTCNSRYRLRTTPQTGWVHAQGGYYLSTQRLLRFYGSSASGGSGFQANWIGYGRHLLLAWTGGYVLTTSPVRAVVLKGKDWHYRLDWPLPSNDQEVACEETIPLMKDN